MFKIGFASGVSSVDEMLARHESDQRKFREEIRLWSTEKEACIAEWKESLADEILERLRKEGWAKRPSSQVYWQTTGKTVGDSRK